MDRNDVRDVHSRTEEVDEAVDEAVDEEEDDDELLTSYNKKDENSDEMLNKGLEQQDEFIRQQENFQRMHQERKDELNPFNSKLKLILLLFSISIILFQASFKYR